MASLFSILLDYAIFAFMINFLREIVKDLEDFNGDKQQEMKTLAIVLGIQKQPNWFYFRFCTHNCFALLR